VKRSRSWALLTWRASVDLVRGRFIAATHTATYCNTPQRAICHSLLCCTVRPGAHVIHLTHCNTLQRTATHCNTLQHANSYSLLLYSPFLSSCDSFDKLQHTATHCNTLQHTQHTASHCTTLHHTAPHCTTLHHAINHSLQFYTFLPCPPLIRISIQNEIEVWTMSSYFQQPDINSWRNQDMRMSSYP